MATKRISQLETIADDLVTGEAILPIVISDPLIPNRKAKVNQLFRGLTAGSQTAPGPVSYTHLTLPTNREV